MTVSFELISNNKARIRSDSLPMIRERLSVYNKNARFIRKKNPHYPERTYAITRAGSFEIGMFYDIMGAIKEMNILPEISMTSDFAKKLIPKFDVPQDFKYENVSLDPYDYQIETVSKMFSFGRGTVLIGTGGGKTLIMALFLKTLFKLLKKKKTLIIVPSLQLVEQTYSDFLEYGFKEKQISKWSGENQFVNTDIIIAGSDIMQSQKSNLDFLSDIEVLIIDEVHTLKKNNLINDIVDKIPTDNRFGFTGTMPEEEVDQWNIIGKIGKIIYEKNSSQLRGDDYVSQAKINIIDIEYNNKSCSELFENMSKDASEYTQELEYIISHPFRNHIISLLAKNTKQNTLIMVDRITHGYVLLDKLTKETNKQVHFIQGSVAVDVREKIRTIMEKNSDVLCIAISSIFSTGINIKNIHNIIFCTPGKAKVKLIQSIGRGLRLHKDKVFLIVYDIADNLKYSAKHLVKRIALYKSENLPYEITKIKEKDDN